MASGSSTNTDPQPAAEERGWTDPETGVIYPPQRHAGKVGYGPNFGSSVGDKIVGMWEEVRGKITHNQELVQHGEDMFTGKLKRKELLKELQDENDPMFGAKSDNDMPGNESTKNNPPTNSKEAAAQVDPHASHSRKGRGGATRHLNKKK